MPGRRRTACRPTWSPRRPPPSARTRSSACTHGCSRAYFAENGDITDAETLLALWADVGLPPAEFARAGDQGLVEAVVREHNEAVSLGLTGVPAVQMAGNDIPLPGALPYESYRRWVERVLGGGPDGR